MSINLSLAASLSSPTPAVLWQLRSDLLQGGLPPEARALAVLDNFFVFLNELSASMSAHEYSKLASLLDIGAVGGVAVQSLIESDMTTADFWKRLLAGGFSESLMVLASRQYVKAFKAEIGSICQSAAWYLFGELWQLSAQYQPELEPSVRRQHIEKLLTPIRRQEVDDTAKAVLIGRLFQILLLVHLTVELKIRD